MKKQIKKIQDLGYRAIVDLDKKKVVGSFHPKDGNKVMAGLGKTFIDVHDDEDENIYFSTEFGMNTISI